MRQAQAPCVNLKLQGATGMETVNSAICYC